MKKITHTLIGSTFNIILAASVMVTAIMLLSLTAFAAPNPDVTQQINSGTLSTDILDENRDPVAAPTAAMTAQSFNFDCQTSTGTLGTNSQRIYVSNPGDAATSWSLSMAATGGSSATWTDGSETYNYNDPSGTPVGCDNGQLTVDPSTGTVTTDCTGSACMGATVAKGSSAAMTSATPVALMSGGANANNWRGYLTDIGLSQVIPAGQPAGSYTINMTITVTGS